MKKDKMYGYRFMKPILGRLFKWYYNPTIIGKENIPKEGSILVVGNHIHVLDQCLVIIATKRPLHYMAKREYFDNKKVAWFFKLAGCIPVDRKIKDNVATGKALDVLNNGFALGLFPEGTRNGLKEERIKELYDKYKKDVKSYDEFSELVKKQRTSQVNYLEELLEKKVIKKKEFISNLGRVDDYLKKLLKKDIITEDEYYNSILLEFKFGSVSMAKKTDSYLVPYGITGEYKFRSKDLTVNIGKPIKVSDDLEASNKELRDEIIRLMKESYKNSGK